MSTSPSEYELSLVADKVRVAGPKVDGGMTVSFEVGEHEQLKVAALLALPQGVPIQLEIKV